MKKEMLINVLQPEECRIAILEDGVLEELYVERTSAESFVGNIYKGRIVNLEPSIQAAFVDFGVGRNGFLHVSDVEPAYYRHLEGYRESGRDIGRGGRGDGGGRGNGGRGDGGRGRRPRDADRPPRQERYTPSREPELSEVMDLGEEPLPEVLPDVTADFPGDPLVPEPLAREEAAEALPEYEVEAAPEGEGAAPEGEGAAPTEEPERQRRGRRGR